MSNSDSPSEMQIIDIPNCGDHQNLKLLFEKAHELGIYGTSAAWRCALTRLCATIPFVADVWRERHLGPQPSTASPDLLHLRVFDPLNRHPWTLLLVVCGNRPPQASASDEMRASDLSHLLPAKKLASAILNGQRLGTLYQPPVLYVISAHAELFRLFRCTKNVGGNLDFLPMDIYTDPTVTSRMRYPGDWDNDIVRLEVSRIFESETGTERDRRRWVSALEPESGSLFQVLGTAVDIHEALAGRKLLSWNSQ